MWLFQPMYFTYQSSAFSKLLEDNIDEMHLEGKRTMYWNRYQNDWKEYNVGE